MTLKITTLTLSACLIMLAVFAPMSVLTVVGGPLLVACILLAKAWIGLDYMKKQQSEVPVASRV